MTNTPPEHEFEEDGVDLDGPVTERTARALRGEVKGVRSRSFIALVAAVIAIVSCLITGWSLYRQKVDRCETGNKFRLVIKGNNTGMVKYLDSYALALGVDPNFDISKLPESQQAKAKETIDKLNKARFDQLKRNDDPALKKRVC